MTVTTTTPKVRQPYSEGFKETVVGLYPGDPLIVRWLDQGSARLGEFLLARSKGARISTDDVLTAFDSGFDGLVGLRNAAQRARAIQTAYFDWVREYAPADQ